MRKFYFSVLFLFLAGSAFAQEELSKEEKARREKNIEAGNPFKQFGYKAKVATLSKGKYLEVHDLDSIVIIGSVRFHVDRKEIVGLVERDSSYGMYTRPIVDIPSRWLSPDPLSEEYRRWSPYTFAVDNPVFFTDPDGMRVIPGTDGKAVTYTRKSDGTLAWSANASADTQRIGNGLARTATGMQQLDKARDATHNVSFKVDSETVSTKFGATTKDLSVDKDGNVKIKSAEVVIFEKQFETFKEMIDAGYEFKDPQAQELAKISDDKEGMISATSGHEIDHATDPVNAQQSYENKTKGTNHDTEKKAEATESKIIQELIDAKPK